MRKFRAGRVPFALLGLAVAGLLALTLGEGVQSIGAGTSKYDPGKINGKVFGASSIKTCKNATNTVPFGANFELSGPLSAFGASSSQGVTLASQEINSKGGFLVGTKCYKIDLTTQDDRRDAATAVAQIRGLVNDKSIRYVFGPAVGSLAVLTQAVTQNPNPPA